MATPYELLLGMSLLQKKKRLQHQKDSQSEGNRFIQLNINSNEIFVRQHDIEEIISVSQITGIANSKAWFKGLTSFRGSLLPLIDMSILLNGKDEQKSTSPEMRVLVIKAMEGLLGLCVEKVEGIQHHWLEKQNNNENTPPYCQLYKKQNNELVSVLLIDEIRKSRELLNIK